MNFHEILNFKFSLYNKVRMTIYTETMAFIEEFEEYLRDNKDEYKEGEIDDENFDNELKEYLDGYVFDLSDRDCKDIVVEYGIGNAVIDFYSKLKRYEDNDIDEDCSIEAQFAYYILFDNITNYYGKIKNDMYRIWNE